MPTLHALVYLGWRAVLVEPVKRLFQRGSGLERFEANFAADRLSPTSAADREVALLAARCTGCGLCEQGGLAQGASPGSRALGLPAAFRLIGRSSGDLVGARELLADCRASAGGASRCPAAIPFGPVLDHLAARAGLPDR